MQPCERRAAQKRRIASKNQAHQIFEDRLFEVPVHCGLRTQPTDSRPAKRFSCNGTLPVGPERSVVTRTASPERKLMLMNTMSEFDAGDRNRRIGKGLEAFH